MTSAIELAKWKSATYFLGLDSLSDEEISERVVERLGKRYSKFFPDPSNGTPHVFRSDPELAIASQRRTNPDLYRRKIHWARDFLATYSKGEPMQMKSHETWQSRRYQRPRTLRETVRSIIRRYRAEHPEASEADALDFIAAEGPEARRMVEQFLRQGG